MDYSLINVRKFERRCGLPVGIIKRERDIPFKYKDIIEEVIREISYEYYCSGESVKLIQVVDSGSVGEANSKVVLKETQKVVKKEKKKGEKPAVQKKARKVEEKTQAKNKDIITNSEKKEVAVPKKGDIKKDKETKDLIMVLTNEGEVPMKEGWFIDEKDVYCYDETDSIKRRKFIGRIKEKKIEVGEWGSKGGELLDKKKEEDKETYF